MKSKRGKRLQKARPGKAKTGSKKQGKKAVSPSKSEAMMDVIPSGLEGAVVSIPPMDVYVPGQPVVTTTDLPPNVRNRVAEILKQYAKCKCK
jgi:hypothetical protein